MTVKLNNLRGYQAHSTKNLLFVQRQRANYGGGLKVGYARL